MSNFVVPSGRMYFNPRNALGQLAGERYIGVTSEFGIELTTQSIEHQNTDDGIAVKDDGTIISLTRKASFKGSNISKENLALFLIGENSVIVQAAGAVTAETVNGGVALQGDRFYQLGVIPGNLSGVRGITAPVMKTGATTHVLNTDYTADLTLGRIYVPIGSPMVGVIVAADYTKTAGSRIHIETSNLAEQNGEIRFIANNARGHNRDVWIPSVTISGSGTLALKGNTYQEFTFDMEINTLEGYKQLYIDGRPGILLD